MIINNDKDKRMIRRVLLVILFAPVFLLQAQTRQNGNICVIVMRTYYVDDTKSSKPLQRMPNANDAYVYYDGERIWLNETLKPSHLDIVTTEGEVVCSSDVDVSQEYVVLPSLLKGRYYVQVNKEDIIYYGYLDL